MAIGKQGAYATVEGGVVDFGKITTEAIDKYQTQQALQEKLKQEKAAAKAKGISDEVKNLRTMGTYATSGMKEIDDPALLFTGQFANALDVVGQKVQTGEASSYEYNQLVGKGEQMLAVMNQSAKYARERIAEYTKLADGDELNPDYIVKPDTIGNMLKHTVPVVNDNGSTTFNYKDADGNIIKTENPNEIIDRVFGKPVLKVELNTELKKIKDILDQDKIATAGPNFVVTKTEQSKRFLGGVSSSAVNLLGNRNIKASLWSDYQKSLPEDKRVGLKADDFSEKENQDLYNYTYNKVLGMYPEEKSLANIPKSGGGNNNDKTTFIPDSFDPSQSFEGYGKRANGLAITVSDPSDKKNQVILSTVPIGKGGARGKISNGLVTSVMYDNRGKMVANITYVDWKSTKLTKEQKERGISLLNTKGIDNLDSIADELGVSSATLAEQRKVLVQPLGESAKAQVLSKLGRSDAQLKKELGYSNTAKPTSTKTTTKKEISRGDIASKAQAAGYSIKEYEALLIKNGVTIK